MKKTIKYALLVLAGLFLFWFVVNLIAAGLVLWPLDYKLQKLVKRSTNLIQLKDEDSCIKAGGEWKNWGGFSLSEYCQRRAKDAEKKCISRFQCEYRCNARWDDQRTFSSGNCAAYENEPGCRSEINFGIVGTQFCD